MPCISVCSVENMPATVERVRPARLVSLLTGDGQPSTPPELPASDHLRVLVDDIDEPQPGFVVPSEAHAEQLVAFLRASPRDGSIVIHCRAGVSRSPAAALIALVLDAPGREREAVAMLRAAAPFALPNRLLVRLADRALDRRGALIDALDATS